MAVFSTTLHSLYFSIKEKKSDPGDKSKCFSTKNALLLVINLWEGLTVVFLAKPLLGFFVPMTAVSHGAWVNLKPPCCCDRSGPALLHHFQAHTPYFGLLWLKSNPMKHRGDAELTRSINEVPQVVVVLLHDLMMPAQRTWWGPTAGSKAGLFYWPPSNSLRQLLKRCPATPWCFSFRNTFYSSCPRFFLCRVISVSCHIPSKNEQQGFLYLPCKGCWPSAK